MRLDPSRKGVACLALAAWTASAADLPSNVRIRHLQTAAAVASALEGASRRLGQPRCQDVFSRFTDASGRPLRQLLEEQGETGQAYLASVLFYDGSKQPNCAREGVAASTFPGSRVVFICPATFRAVHRTDKRAAEMIVIHEMLHSLGLGENPPSTWRITGEIHQHCR